MKTNLAALLFLMIPSTQAELRDAVQTLSQEVVEKGHAYSNLSELVQFGHRLSGSAGEAKAIQWAKKKMESYGFDRIRLEPVQVPHWVRGSIEKVEIVGPGNPEPLRIAALGGSVGTPSGGIEAPVIEVQSLKEVEQLGTAGISGKIVFYNRPMNPDLKDKFESYAQAVDQRSKGAAVASKYGAVAVLVRTLTTLPDDDHPHTGNMNYSGASKKIPAAAVSTHGAGILSRRLKSDSTLRVRMELSAESRPPVPSYNVMGEITGRELPEEYVVVGGHLDSWDLASGAHDDGAGVVQSIEVLRAIKQLGLKPKRTIRVVLFAAEEFGGIGGNEYAKQVASKKEKHVAAIESDCGGFSPVGFSTGFGTKALQSLKSWKSHFAELKADQMTAGFSGTDIEPLDALGTATIGLRVDSTHYFDYHHSELDHLNAVDPAELHRGAAAMAILAYLISENGI